LETGSSYLGDSLKYKAFGTAASGALIGTVVGGPVGFLAGAKLGAIVGIGTGTIGYLAARYLRK
jgi:syntaxin 17